MTQTGSAELADVGTLLERIASDLLPSGVSVRDFRPLDSDGPSVADASTKALLVAPDGRPEAVLLVANPATPSTVALSMTRAREVAERLGPRLGSVVLAPLLTGEFEGRSYAVLPWRRAPAEKLWPWRAQKTWLVPRMLRWLRDVAQATASELAADRVADRVSDPLERLVADTRMPDDMRRDAETTLRRAANGQWCPKMVLAHDDLWKGNVLLPRNRGERRSAAYGFHLIDWAGAQLPGFAFWDLAKLGGSLSFPARWARREIRRHAALLGCEPADAVSYLLAGVADLAGRLEHMPVDHYLESSQRAYRFVHSGAGPALQK